MEPVFIIAAIFIVAVLYSSVGHGGASGYLAVMAFLAVPPEITRPTALTLNLFVASIAFVQFYRSGFFSWSMFWPFAAASIPMAYLGGRIELPAHIYKVILGIVLILTAIRLSMSLISKREVSEPRLPVALAIGAAIGIVSGMVGVGGGIFLTPVLLLMNWSEARTAAGVSALFILVNSIAGLAGLFNNAPALPVTVLPWLAAAIIGGILGSAIGSKRFDTLALRRTLAAVLVLAGAKLIFV